MPQEALRTLAGGGSLSREEARDAMTAVMDGQATPAQIGALLFGLRVKGETIDEVAGSVDALRERVLPVRAHRSPLLDTCGTGGSAFRVFNVSTIAAFVAASAGIAVAKHGNRAMSGICGSADVLEALGVRVGLTAEQCAECIDTVGIGFLFAPQHHPAMRQVSGPRRELGVRTIFNLLGPLTNPAGAQRQVMGVYEPRLTHLAAGALKALGSERALVVHGEVGLDEISTIGRTHICELRDGTIHEYTLTRADLGLEAAEPDPAWLLPATTPMENAEIVRETLSGPSDDQQIRARQELVAVNVAAALRVSCLAEEWPEAVRLALRLLISGQPLALLHRLAHFTQQY